MMVTRLRMLSGMRGVMIGSCVDVAIFMTMLARAFAPGKASALLSFTKLQPRLDRCSARHHRLQAGFAYSADDIGLILKARRCRRFASRCGSVFVPASLSLSMMS